MRKIGHAGTLDPLAEGLLIILLNKATRLSYYFLSMDKEYVSEFKLGVVTDTWDLDGRIVESKKIKNLNAADTEKKLSSLIGEYRQVPPIYSAIKYKGKPLYYYARKGKKVKAEPRLVKINNIGMLSLAGDILTVRINCSSGTYVRSIANEVGEMLGCGAAVKSLTRTKIGTFNVKNSIKLEDFVSEKFDSEDLYKKPFFISLEEVLRDNQDIYVKDEYKKMVKNGQPVSKMMIDNSKIKSRIVLKKGELVKIKDTSGKLMAIHEIFNETDYKKCFNEYIKLTKSIVIC